LELNRANGMSRIRRGLFLLGLFALGSLNHADIASNRSPKVKERSAGSLNVHLLLSFCVVLSSNLVHGLAPRVYYVIIFVWELFGSGGHYYILCSYLVSY
jgi:hypothetical protein